MSKNKNDNRQDNERDSNRQNEDWKRRETDPNNPIADDNQKSSTDKSGKQASSRQSDTEDNTQRTAGQPNRGGLTTPAGESETRANTPNRSGNQTGE